MKIKNKKSLIALFALMFLTVSGTLAYYVSSTVIGNLFEVGTFTHTVTEVFNSPSSWTPGDVTPKTVVIKNTGTVPTKVRVKLVEEWRDANNNLVPLVYDGLPVAIINFANTSDWTKSGEYYYYNGTLNTNGETSTFISSVRLNENVELAATVCKTINSVTNCENSTGFSGKHYKLTVVAELVQSDAYNSVWSVTDSEISTPTKHFVTYDANGGTISKFRDVVTNGENYSLPTGTKTGYTLEGWYLDSSFTNKITNSTTINLNEDKIVFAKWVEE